MQSSDSEFLLHFGWNDFFESQIPDLVRSSLFPARVICEERNLFRVQSGFNKIFWAQVSGKMQFEAKSRADFPAVGDWVMIELAPQADRGVIHNVLPRKTTLHRKVAGLRTDMQILSTNVNYGFITSSVNTDLNYRRIERYLAVVWDAGCIPVILLTKADLSEENIDDVVLDVEREFPGVQVFALSKDNFEQAEFLSEYLKIGSTSVFIGSSGVGKSTLVNFLIGSEQAKTQDIREDDEKGRHTTTARHLYISRYGGLIIDTPGMRELQLSDHTEGVSSQFYDIEELIQSCRFGDCHHETEPGCAIKKALSDDLLSIERWKNYLKLEAEIRHGLRKADKALAAADKKIWKQKTSAGRERGLAKKRGF